MTDRAPTPAEVKIAEVLATHHWGDDTARQYDSAAQCGCGKLFYQIGGTPGTYLDAHRRLVAAFHTHVAEQIARALLASPQDNPYRADRQETDNAG